MSYYNKFNSEESNISDVDLSELDNAKRIHREINNYCNSSESVSLYSLTEVIPQFSNESFDKKSELDKLIVLINHLISCHENNVPWDRTEGDKLPGQIKEPIKGLYEITDYDEDDEDILIA